MQSPIIFTAAPAGITMTSLELVDFINHERKADDAELRHADFLTKVPKVLGGDERKFSSVYVGGNGQERPCYRFPKREACLMAMSYSYDLQAKVFDRMTALEQAMVTGPAAPVVPVSKIKIVSDSLIAQHDKGMVSKREAFKLLKATIIAESPGIAAVLESMSAKRQKPAVIVSGEQMALPVIQAMIAPPSPAPVAPKAVRKQAEPRATHLRLKGEFALMNIDSSTAFVLREVASFVEATEVALQYELARFGLMNEHGAPTTKAAGLHTGRGQFRRWRIRATLRAIGVPGVAAE